MTKRARLTEQEAYGVKTRRSEPIGARGKGSLLLERKGSGAIFAYYRERIGSTDKRLFLGILAKHPKPQTTERTLDEMRTEAARIAAGARAAGGLDRHLELDAERQAATAIEQEKRRQIALEESMRGTLADLLELYVENLERSGKASAGKVRSLFRVNVLDFHPDLAARYSNDIRPDDIKALLEAVLERKPRSRGIGNKAKAPATNMRSTADELRRYITAAYNYAAASHLAVGTQSKLATKRFALTNNPAALIPPIEGASGGTTESLTPDELGEIIRYLRTLPERKQAIALALIYSGGQRVRQFLAVSWEDIDDSTMSMLDAKGRKDVAWEHLLPLTPRLKEIMAPLLTDRVGPGPFSFEPDAYAHPDTVTRIFRDASQTLAPAGKTSPFSWQRIRATCETLLAANGVSTETRAWLLSHGRTGVQAKHYDRNSYLPEKTEALLLWGTYLDRLAASPPGSKENVVALRKRRSARA